MSSWPGTAVAGTTIFVTPMSADSVPPVMAVAVLFPGVGSSMVIGGVTVAVFTRAPVGGVSGPAPLISANGFNDLFGTVAFFSLGKTDRNAPATPRFQHNGGAGVNGGFVNGNVAIFESPGGDVYTAFYDANGNLPADDAFDAAFGSLVFP